MVDQHLIVLSYRAIRPTDTMHMARSIFVLEIANKICTNILARFNTLQEWHNLKSYADKYRYDSVLASLTFH